MFCHSDAHVDAALIKDLMHGPQRTSGMVLRSDDQYRLQSVRTCILSDAHRLDIGPAAGHLGHDSDAVCCHAVALQFVGRQLSIAWVVVPCDTPRPSETVIRQEHEWCASVPKELGRTLSSFEVGLRTTEHGNRVSTR